MHYKTGNVSMPKTNRKKGDSNEQFKKCNSKSFPEVETNLSRVRGNTKANNMSTNNTEVSAVFTTSNKPQQPRKIKRWSPNEARNFRAFSLRYKPRWRWVNALPGRQFAQNGLLTKQNKLKTQHCTRFHIHCKWGSRLSWSRSRFYYNNNLEKKEIVLGGFTAISTAVLSTKSKLK